MNPVPAEQLVRQLNWRYATKAFDVARSIPPETWEALEHALILTPSSFGLQPWRFVVIADRGLRERLLPHAWGQRQIADSSHLIVFCIRRDLGAAEIDAYLERISEVRGTPPEKLAGFRQAMVGSLVQGPLRPVINEWATRQVYIALGNFMTSAALLGVDTCPLEGFEPDRFDEVLELRSQGLSSVVCCAAGYRSPGDRYAMVPKVRFRPSDVIQRF